MSVSYWLDKSQSKKTCDVAIVGGGLAGFSTAYWLKKEDPSLHITIFEKGTIGSGASGRNAGFITCGSVEHFSRLCERWGTERALEQWRFSEINLQLMKEHIIQDDKSLEFEENGTFSLASEIQEFNELKETARLMAELDIAVEVVEGDDIQRRVGGQNFVGGIKYLKDAAIHPIKLLRKMAEKANVEVVEGAEVFDLHATSAGTTSFRTTQYEVESNITILAMNGYSSHLKKYFADKIYPTRGQILVTEPVPKFMEAPCYANFVLDYFRQLDDGRMLIGGFRQLEKATEVGYSDHTTDVIQNALYEFLQKHIPSLQNKKVTHRWAGIMGFSFDGQPMVGALPDEPQVYFAGGFTGHGVGLAFHTGKSLVDLLYDRPVPEFISAKRI